MAARRAAASAGRRRCLALLAGARRVAHFCAARASSLIFLCFGGFLLSAPVVSKTGAGFCQFACAYSGSTTRLVMAPIQRSCWAPGTGAPPSSYHATARVSPARLRLLGVRLGCLSLRLVFVSCDGAWPVALFIASSCVSGYYGPLWRGCWLPRAPALPGSPSFDGSGCPFGLCSALCLGGSCVVGIYNFYVGPSGPGVATFNVCMYVCRRDSPADLSSISISISI